MKLLFIDVDSILYDFDSYFVAKAKTMLPEHQSIQALPDGYMPQRMDYAEIPDFVFKKVFGKFPDSWPGELSPYPDARNFTHQLKELGVRVVLLTSLPDSKGLSRLRRMSQDGFHFDEAYFTMSGQKYEYAEAVMLRMGITDQDQVAFVDDMAKHTYKFLLNLPSVKRFTLNVPYNREFYETIPQEDVQQLNLVGESGSSMGPLLETLYDEVLKHFGG